MPSRSRAPAAVAALIVVAAVVAAVFWRESQQTRATVGQPAPDFLLPTLAGDEVALSDLQGDVVLLNFWTTWCDGCIIEMPALVTFQQRYGHLLKLVGVNVQEPVATAAAFLDEFDVNYLTVLDQQGRTPGRYRLRAYPESWVLDRDGIARYHKPGPMTFEEMAAAYELASGQSLAADQRGPLPDGGQARALHTDGTALWLGGSGGLWRFADGAWTPAGPPAAADAGVYAIESDGNGGLLLGTGAGLWHSADGGGNWSLHAPGLPDGPVTGFAAGADGPLAWVVGHGLHRLVDGAWVPEPSTLQLAYPWVRLAAAPDGLLLAGTPDGLWRSTDGGQTWQLTGHRLPVYDLYVAGGTVWLAGDDGVYALAAGPGSEAYIGIRPGREKWLSTYGGAPARRLTALTGAGDTVWTAAPTGDVYASRPGLWELVWPQLTKED